MFVKSKMLTCRLKCQLDFLAWIFLILKQLVHNWKYSLLKQMWFFTNAYVKRIGIGIVKNRNRFISIRIEPNCFKSHDAHPDCNMVSFNPID